MLVSAERSLEDILHNNKTLIFFILSKNTLFLKRDDMINQSSKIKSYDCQNVFYLLSVYFGPFE